MSDRKLGTTRPRVKKQSAAKVSGASVTIEFTVTTAGLEALLAGDAPSILDEASLDALLKALAGKVNPSRGK